MKAAKLALLGLVAGALAAQAYVLTFNSSGFPRRWNLVVPDSSISTNVINPDTRAIRYFIASDGYSTTNTASELNAVRAAFAQWQAIPDTHVRFEDAGLVNPPVDVNLSDDTNTVYWTKTSTFVNGGLNNISGALGVAFTSFTTDDNTLLQGDIVFNGALYEWFTDFFDTNSTRAFVEAVALHEIGHFIGLNHSPAGGATMLFRGAPGVNLQTGLSSDDLAGARCLYPLVPGNYGAAQGLVSKGGRPVFGAAVFAQNSAGNVVAGTVTETNGSFHFGAVPPGNYQIRVAPLDDPAAADFLCRGRDIHASYNDADTDFLPTPATPILVTAGSTNLMQFTLTGGSPAFRITHIRSPASSAGSFAWSSLPASLRAGQSHYTIGVASTNLPTGNATLTISGDGLTLGAPSFFPRAFGLGLNFISVSISVASNATSGLRNFIVQQDTNIAYASGFLEIQPASVDCNFDGLDDAFQRQYFSPFTSPQASPNADPDGDGMTNSSEYIAGTVPTNAASVLKMETPSLAGNGATIRWQSVPGRRYQVASRSSLATGLWQDRGAPVIATNTAAQYFAPTALDGARYFRVQVLP